MRLNAAQIAKNLLIVYVMAHGAYGGYRVDTLVVLFLNVVFFPVFVGPAALAYFLVLKSHYSWQKWSFVAAMLAVILSMIWLVLQLHRFPDAQNEIGRAHV